MLSPVTSRTVKEAIINFTTKMQTKYLEQLLRAFRNQTRSFLFFLYEAHGVLGAQTSCHLLETSFTLGHLVLTSVLMTRSYVVSFYIINAPLWLRLCWRLRSDLLNKPSFN